jgi:hypothetical protein
MPNLFSSSDPLVVTTDSSQMQLNWERKSALTRQKLMDLKAQNALFNDNCDSYTFDFMPQLLSLTLFTSIDDGC